MEITRKTLEEKTIINLLNAVSTFHSPEIAASVAERYGYLHNISRWEQEEMIDGLISKLNDAD